MTGPQPASDPDPGGVGRGVALIGYGRMGRQMGCRLMAAGWRLKAHDVSERARRAAEEDGAEVVGSGGEAAREEILITMLPDPEAAIAAASDEGGILEGIRPGVLWIEMSSSHPATTRALARAAEERAARLLDAPVSGGVAGAREGTLTIMVGGPPELLERARPLLEVLGREILHVGPRPGDGDLAKTINNMLSAVNLTAAGEALTLGVRHGLDAAILVQALGVSSAASHALQVKMPRYVLSGSFDAGFTIGQMLKDLAIAESVADQAGVATPIGDEVRAIWRSFAEDGHTEDDHTAVVALLAARAGVDLSSAP